MFLAKYEKFAKNNVLKIVIDDMKIIMEKKYERRYS